MIFWQFGIQFRVKGCNPQKYVGVVSLDRSLRPGSQARTPSLIHFARFKIVIECYSHLLVLDPGLKPCPWIFIPTLTLFPGMNGDFPISGESKLPYLHPHRRAIITLRTKGDILLLCQAGCINCNSNSDQKKPLPCQDLNPRPPWYQSNALPTELYWLDSC